MLISSSLQNMDADPPLQTDMVEDLIKTQLRQKYGDLNTYTENSRYHGTEEEVAWRDNFIDYILDYHTSRYGLNKDRTSKPVKQTAANLKTRFDKLSVILGKMPSTPEMIDPWNLFLHYELDSGFLGSTKMKYCSDVISLAKAVMWNKSTFPESDRLRKYFDDIGQSSLEFSMVEMRNAKTRFRIDSKGRQIDRDLLKEENTATKEEINKIFQKADEIMNADRGDDPTAFRRHRDVLITCLAAFHPVRLVPLSELTIGEVEKPLRQDENMIVLRVGGGRYKGEHKTFNTYGSALITLAVPMYALLKKYVAKLKSKFRVGDGSAEQYLFCRTDGVALDSIGNIITGTCEEIIGRPLNATDFRRAKTVLGRQAGISKAALSRALMHSEKTADEFYDVKPTKNTASLKYFNHITAEKRSAETDGASKMLLDDVEEMEDEEEEEIADDDGEEKDEDDIVEDTSSSDSDAPPPLRQRLMRSLRVKDISVYKV